MDHSSNRYLLANSPPGEGGFVTFDALLERASSTFELDMHPSVAVQRFSNNSASDSVNRAIDLASKWTGVRSTFGLGGSYSELSTLGTELTSTGVVEGNTRQRQETAFMSWQYQQSENRQLTAQANYNNTTYTGQEAFLLPGYRYPNGSLAERFTLSDRDAITVSASGGYLSSPHSPIQDSSLCASKTTTCSSSTEDEQLVAALDHSFSERLTLYASAGVNDRSSNGRKTGYVGEFTLKRIVDERNQWKLDYTRNVSASGFGVLAQHSAGTVSYSRDLAYQLNAGLAVSYIEDSQDVTSGPLLLQTRKYESADATLKWLSGETSTVSLGAGYSRATTVSEPPTPVAHGWRASISYRWTPRPVSFSR
jgi:hypothetical protein